MVCFESARRHAVLVPLAMEQGGLVKELFYQGNWPLGLGEGRILLRSEQTHSTFEIEVIVLILLLFPSHGVMPEERGVKWVLTSLYFDLRSMKTNYI